jgi:hypothetical protein
MRTEVVIMTTSKRKATITLVLGLCAAMAALPAAAQNWVFEPVLSIGGEIDDNATLSFITNEEAEIQGWIADVRARMAYEAATSSFSLTPRLRSRNYDLEEFDSDDVFVVGDWRQRFRNSRIGIRANWAEEAVRTAERDDSDLDVEDADDITNDGTGIVDAGDRRKLRVRPSWNYDFSGASSVGLAIDYFDVSYKETGITDLNDYQDTRLEGSYQYGFSNITRGIFLASAREFESERASNDFEGYRAMAGFERDLSQTTRVRALIGAESFDFAAADTGSETEMVGELSLFHELQTINILAQYRRSVTASGSTPVIRDNIALNFTRRLTDLLSAGIGTRAYTSTELNRTNPRERNYIQLRATFAWSITPVFDVQFDYRHTILERGDAAGERADSNQVNLFFIYRPNSPKVL